MIIRDISKLRSELKAAGKTIVATNGCFDILHVGHLRYLTESKALADVLVVALNSDSSVKALKGASRPINNQNDRAELLAALSPVDYVVIFEETTANKFLRELKPDIYTKGSDYVDLKNLAEYETLEELGIKIVLIDLVEGKSTTNIIQCLEKE